MDESGAGLPKKLKPPFTTAPAESVGSTSGQSRGGAADGGPLDGGGEGNGGRPASDGEGMLAVGVREEIEVPREEDNCTFSVRVYPLF